uniref:Uncharacterized protein n=1 Tax=Oryza punctata TaxID=4537 RepID=A0A0E0M4D0_ORYPU
MAASLRGLPLSPSPLVAHPCALSRRLAPSPRSRSGYGVRAAAAAAADGGPRPPDPVEVVGVGSRKDAVIDFCLGSRTLSSTPIRFWTMHVVDNCTVQLIQKSHGEDVVVRDLETPLSLQPCPPAVASAGQDADHITAMELLSEVKSAVIEADSLLETEVETLAEALESANNAVLSTISMISIMMSGLNQAFRSSINAQIMEVNPDELGKLIRSYGEARVGFGAGYNIQSAIKQAVFHCPFLRGGIKDLNNVVFLSITSSRIFSESDMVSTLHIFRRVTGFTEDIIFSRNCEPDLEPKLIVVSLLTVRNSTDENVASAKEGFLSGLALHFPLISSLMGRDIPEQKQATLKHSYSKLPGSGLSLAEQEFSRLSSAFTNAVVNNLFPEETDIMKSERKSKEKTHTESQEAKFEPDGEMSEDREREHLGSEQEHKFWSNSPGIGIARLWAKVRMTSDGGTQNNDINIITLPVGVKSPEVQCGADTRPEAHSGASSTSAASGHAAFGVSFSDIGLEKVTEMYSSAVTFLKGGMDRSRKRGSVANRAALMLDAERELEKTWSPIVEIQFGGGIYRGRCQEGVPEGKGRITFSDGSFYEGLWRYGKRSSLGTLYYSNGDVFHGTWRDDLFHGKGWYYFHSGDRWFANFWKGRANGEGRFYAKDGSVFFGNFQNGWRHGEALLIDANGSRFLIY